MYKESNINNKDIFILSDIESDMLGITQIDIIIVYFYMFNNKFCMYNVSQITIYSICFKCIKYM